jgi:acetolactate synthase-1/2/3 large subunit
MTFENPDFAAYARSHHAKGIEIETADGLASALEVAIREGGVHLIAAPIDYAENTRVLIDELRNAELDSSAERQ